ncbi:hypothetical protein ACWC5I_00490 [Kitasatospora sp. NPDC001574]
MPAAAQLQTLVSRVHCNERVWDNAIRANVPGYNPTDPDQPTDDEHMPAYSELADERAHAARRVLLNLTAELEALIREMEDAQ